MKINWFSPVPPAPTAIANVTERVIPSVAEKMEVTVWTDVEDFDASRIPGVEVRSCRETTRIWPELNFADFSIYHIGNDVRFHGHYSWMLERHPGVVVLHDFNLHELQRERHLRMHNGTAAFNRYVLRMAGSAALQTVLAFQRGEIEFEVAVERVPLIQSVTQFGTGIISFNEAMREPLRKETKVPLLLCPLPLERRNGLPACTERSYKREESPLQCVMFGFLNSPNRRLREVLEAMAQLDDAAVQLTLFGHIEDRESLDRQIRELGIGQRVRYMGYLSDEDMEAVLKSSHLAINLRNPTRGESSDALLKAWKYALPVVVTKTGYYETLPAETVCPVEPGNEVDGLVAHIEAFRRSPETYLQAGRAAHAFMMENHTAEAFADNLLKYLVMAESYRKKTFVFSFSRRLAGKVEEECHTSRSAGQLRSRLATELTSWIADPEVPTGQAP